MKKIEVIVDKTKREVTIEVNPVGLQGPPMKFSDLTQEEKDSLKGDKGEPFRFEDFTPQQINELKVKGDQGEPFRFEDLTEEQKQEIFTKYMDNYVARW